MHRFLTSLLIAVALLTAGTAYAQQQPPVRPVGPEEGTEIPESARLADIKVGPFYLQPRLGLRDVGWSDNPLGVPNSNELKVSDFQATGLGGLRFYLPFRERHVISGDGEAAYQWFQDNEEFRGWNTAIEGRYEYDSDRLEASIVNRYVNSQFNQLEQLELDTGGTGAPDAEIFARVRSQTNDLRAELQFNYTRQTFVGARGGRRIVRYPGESEQAQSIARTLDRTEDSIGGFVGTSLRPGLAVRAFYDYQDFDYEAPGNPRDASSYRTGVELALSGDRRFSGLVRLGYRDLTPDLEELIGFSGMIFDADVRGVIGSRTEVTISGIRDALPSLFGDNIFFVRSGGGVDLVYQVTRRIGLGAGVQIYDHAYELEVTQTQPDGTVLTAVPSEQIYQYEGIFTWRLNRNEIRVRAGYFDRSSNFASQESDGLIISTGYVARF